MKLPLLSKSVFKIAVKHNLTRLSLECSRPVKSFVTECSAYESLIISNTVISNDHLTPELKLRLITPDCELWHCKSSESKFPDDPFWGIYWPGGQALGRYILDNAAMFHNKNVIDIGSGSGACALAAAKCGAKHVLANDIDPVSILAVSLNAHLNTLKVQTSSDDLIGQNIDHIVFDNSSEKCNIIWDLILIGDMFYDVDFSKNLFMWLISLVQLGKMVFVGDPGRHALLELDKYKHHGCLVKVAEYSLKNIEHNGFSTSSVYKLESKLLCNF